MDKEVEARLPKYKWQILDIEKAREAKIKLLDIDENTTFLVINLQDIPKGMAVIDYLELIQTNGIVFLNKDENEG